MPNRDYAARAKSKKGGNKLLILIIILLLLLLSGLGLWMLSSSAPQAPVATTPAQTEQQQKNALPSRPEEVYSYIRDLETREVPVDKNSKLAKLTKEQEQQILKKQEEEKQRLALQSQTAQPTAETATVAPTETQAVENSQQSATEQPAVELTEEQLAAKKAQEKKVAEEKRKQAELKKQQELAKKAELEKQKAEQEKQKAAQQPAKVVATAKPATEAPKPIGKYGLQCGAFKNKAQAENMQARLAMAGYNAKISSNAEWNRVFVGPIGDRAAASAAQSNARSVAECLIVGMQ